MFNLSLNINVSFCFRRDLSRLYCSLGSSFQTCSQLLLKNFRDCITVHLSRFLLLSLATALLDYHICRFLSTSFFLFFTSSFFVKKEL